MGRLLTAVSQMEKKGSTEMENPDEHIVFIPKCGSLIVCQVMMERTLFVQSLSAFRTMKIGVCVDHCGKKAYVQVRT